MGRLVYHRKKDTGLTYVYEVVEEYWDKTKKQMRSKQVCIGKLDPDTGEIIPSKRFKQGPPTQATATTRVIGPTRILDKIAQDIGLKATLRQSFPKQWERILTLASFILCTGGALVHADAWCQNHEVWADESCSSQRVSEWLEELTEEGRQAFFKFWVKRISEQDYFCYDITSVSSYSYLNEYVRYGYNRDGEPLPQINLGLVTGQRSRLPVTYRILPGAISDVSTVQVLLKSFDKLDYPKMTLIMDRGFYSQRNVNDLLERRHAFIIGVPGHLKWVREVIDRCQEAQLGPRGYQLIDDEALYMHTELIKWANPNRRCYLHVYYNAHRAADDLDELSQRLLACKEELESGQLDSRHEADYQAYFTVKETPVRGRQVDYNDEAIREYRNRYAGFFTILTSHKMTAKEVLEIYRDKDVVEKSFDDLKNQLDLKRLRVHSSGRMQARIFIQFIALILQSRIQKIIREETALAGRYSPKLLLGEMESLTKIHYSGRYKDLVSEVSKKQRVILQAFSIKPNTL